MPSSRPGVAESSCEVVQRVTWSREWERRCTGGWRGRRRWGWFLRAYLYDIKYSQYCIVERLSCKFSFMQDDISIRIFQFLCFDDENQVPGLIRSSSQIMLKSSFNFDCAQLMDSSVPSESIKFSQQLHECFCFVGFVHRMKLENYSANSKTGEYAQSSFLTATLWICKNPYKAQSHHFSFVCRHIHSLYTFCQSFQSASKSSQVWIFQHMAHLNLHFLIHSAFTFSDQSLIVTIVRPSRSVLIIKNRN